VEKAGAFSFPVVDKWPRRAYDYQSSLGMQTGKATSGFTNKFIVTGQD